MRINSVSVRDFKGIGGLDVEFAEGINLVHGHNEAGKSTLMEAIRAALFEKANTGASDTLGSWAPWGREATPEVTLRFEAGGDVYEVSKTFAGSKGRAVLLRGETGEELADAPQSVDKRLGSLLRMGSAAFLYSAWAEQGGIERVLDKASSTSERRGREQVQARLRKLGLEAAGSTVEAERALESRARRFTAKKERDIRDRLSQARAREGRLGSEEQERRGREKAAELDAEALEEVLAALGEIDPAIAKDAEFLEAKGRHDSFKEKLQRAEKDLKQAEEAATELGRRQEQLTEAEEEARAAKAKADSARETVRSSRRRKRRLELTSVLADVREAQERIGKLGALAGREAPSENRLRELEEMSRRAATLGGEIRALETAATGAGPRRTRGLAAALLSVGLAGLGTGCALLVASLGYRALSVIWPTAALALSAGPAIIGIVLLIRSRIALSGRNVAALRTELGGMENEIRAALGQWGAPSVSELRSMVVESEHAAGELRREEKRLERLLDGRPKDDLDRELAGLEADPAVRDGGDLPAVEEAQQGLADASSEVEVLGERIRGHRDQLKKLKKRQTDVQALGGLRDELRLEYGAAKAQLESLERYALAPETRASYGKRKKELEARRTELEVRCEAHRRADSTMVSEEKVQEARDAAESLQMEFDSFRLEREALSRVSEALEEAKAEFASRLAKPIGDKIATMLPGLTAGRYESAELDDRLGVNDISGQAAVDAGVGALSVGAREQVALAMRLAMVEALSGDEPQLVVLDEALLGFDAERMRAACGVLAEYAERHQVIIMTARPETLDFPAGTKVNEVRLGT